MEKLKAFFTKVWTFLNSRVFLYALIILAILWMAKTCSNLKEQKQENTIHKQNELALTDSIKLVKLKNGSLQAEKAGFIASEKDLKKLNENLSNEVKAQKGKVISLNEIVFQLQQSESLLNKHINYLESLMGKPIQVNDSSYTIPWTMRYDWDSINYDIYKGQTQIGLKIKPGFIWKDGMTNNYLLNNAFNMTHYGTSLTERTSQMQLTFGQKIEKNQLRIFVNTNYPGFTPKSLEGVLIDPNTNPYIKKLMKKTQWFPGTWSVGVGPSLNYGLNGKFGVGFGLNLNYTLFQF